MSEDRMIYQAGERKRQERQLKKIETFFYSDDQQLRRILEKYPLNINSLTLNEFFLSVIAFFSPELALNARYRIRQRLATAVGLTTTITTTYQQQQQLRFVLTLIFKEKSLHKTIKATPFQSFFSQMHYLRQREMLILKNCK